MFKNYTINQTILPLDMEQYIPETDVAFAVNALVEAMPQTLFLELEEQLGRPAYHPKMMLKIILYAYTQRVFSGRKIEFLLDDSYRMRWLANHEQVSYRTINRFRSQETTAHLLAEAFVLFRRQLITNQVIDNEAIFIDGTKIEADANKFSFVWHKATNRYEAALDKQSNEFYQALYKEEILPYLKEESQSEGLTSNQLEEIAHHLETELVATEEQLQNEKKKEKQSQLKKKRRTYKKYLRKIQADYLPRKQKYETYNRLFQERNSFSKTDTDATFMRMKDDYMRNGQLKPGYNLQIATESQYVLAYDLFPNPTDTKTLNPFLDSFLEQHNELPEYIVADAGYGSEENYMYINDILHKTPLITYASYHKENKKTYRERPFVVDNWQYLEEKDTYICPAQRAVPFKQYSRRKDKNGFVRDFKIYECENCRDCPVRSQCTKAKSEQNRQILVNNTWRYFKAECKKKLLEEKTGSIYRKRKIDVEPVFGHLKAHLAFHRFHLRGKQGAKIDIGLALMALNLRKLGKYMERKRRKEEKTSPILKLTIKIGLVFFWRKDYCPTLVFSCLISLMLNCV
ncbi:TPA: IS1182 family transposase [Enterococcus faecium]|uniref:IS1182 family transposase n=1 Tax=Enterococcus faecium TaxID=1352 RepID=UPI001A058CF4|nr:IS1182 family transposase [Enterococcus faecium]EME3494263.1 IS1182 family transposase [Enterococcus faecium]EME3512261.1 IS1182 family transposase [Enterococcus faecium]EME7226760.1 IS1182 family transposase [Enterococcus faecium]EMF0444146.1 IS1182 family transposase [Enterococcus faecium]